MINTTRLLTALLVVIAGFSVSQLNAQSFEWAKSMGGANLDEGYAITADGAGNVYTTGGFLGPADFDPGPGTVTLTSFGAKDVFIQKLDENGDLDWVKSIGNVGSTESYDITRDISGNIYVTGSFEGTLDFDPGSGVFELTSEGGDDVFILKLNNSGDFLWAKSIGGSSGDVGVSISTDAFGNSYAAGYFRLTADFNPGSGTFDLTSAGSRDGFVLKLDSGGNFLWAKQLGGTSPDEIISMVVDGAGNVYSVGTFEGTVDFNPGSGTFDLTAFSSDDIFISKLDGTGNFVWAKQFEVNGAAFPTAVDVDLSGNVYTAGYFLDDIDVDPGVGINNLNSNAWDVFVVKLDATGNLFWANQIGGSDVDYCYGLKIDENQNVHITGEFRGTVDFDPGQETDELTAAGTLSDVFVQKFDALGNHLWVRAFGGPDENDFGLDIFARGGNVYTTGRYIGTVDFDTGTSVVELTSAGSADCFIHKLGENSSSVSEFENNVEISVYPNPNDGLFEISFENATEDVSLTLTNLQGKILYSKQLAVTSKEQLEINAAPGVYLLRVSTPQGQSVFQIVKE